MGRRILATCCDLVLVFFLSLFIIGKLWLPNHYAEAIVQFKMLWDGYGAQFAAGQFLPLLSQINENKSILDMFSSVNLWLFFVTWGYYVINAMCFKGGSLGKQIFNLRVLKSMDLKIPSFGDSCLRSCLLTFFLFTAWPFLVCFNVFYMCLNPLHRGIHDKLTHTYVISCHVLDELREQLKQKHTRDEGEGTE